MEFPVTWRLSLLQAMIVVAVLMLVRAGTVVGDTTDFSNPITCYKCMGPADNSSCSDYFDTRLSPPTKDNTKVCNHGVCLKWTRYHEGILIIERTCSADLKFKLTMIDGVCRTERNGNGRLCMCGKHLCNAASRLTPFLTFIPTLITAYAAHVQRPL